MDFVTGKSRRLSRIVRGSRGVELGAQRRNLGSKRFELLAPDQVEIGGDLIGLSADGVARFFSGGLSQAHGGLSQFGHFVEKRISGLHGRVLGQIRAYGDSVATRARDTGALRFAAVLG